MPKGKNQSVKALLLRDILFRETNEAHPMTAEELIVALDRYGVSAERKSIYEDIEKLNSLGDLEIEHRRGPNGGYYIEDREFELSELKLLVDLVQCCRFITEKKSRILIKKLETLTNKYAAAEMQHQVHIQNRVKNTSENIYYTVDAINDAINSDSMIAFHYYEYTAEKKKRFRRDGKLYRVSPFALNWSDSNYYVICVDEEARGIRPFRVDKMCDLEVLDRHRNGLNLFPDCDPAAYCKKLFGMYGGEETTVEIKMKESLADVAIDRFGEDIVLLSTGDGHFTINVTVKVSPQFFGWLAGLGDGAQIIAPIRVREQFLEYVRKMLEQYEDPQG